MPQDATCPRCQVPFPVTEARHAFTVACPRCDAEMTVEFKRPAAPPEAGQPHYDLLVRPGALVGTPPPAPKRKKDVDEDDEPRAAGGSALIVALSGGLGLLVVLGGLGLTAWVLFGLIDTTPSTAPSRTQAKTNAPNAPNRPSPGPNVPPPNNPGPFNPGPAPFNPPPKPKDTFDLKPVAGPVPPIVPPALPFDPSNVELGGKVGALAVGGGGRYLVMHFPEKGLLGVFDVNELRVTATVPADRDDMLVAAGLTKVVLGRSGGARVFRVYSLPDLAKQYDAGGADALHGMAMGSRTDGPLLTVSVFGKVSLWDVGPAGLTEVEGSAAEPGVHWQQRGVRALPDGTAFATFDGFHPHNKTTLLTAQGRKWKTVPDVAQVPFPGPDGHFYGNGVAVTPAGQNYPVGGVGAGSNTWLVPSVSSKDYFLSIAPLTVGTGVRAKKTLAVTVHKARNASAAAPGTAVFSDLPEFEGLADRWGTTPPVPYDQHFFLVPEAKLLLTLNQSRDRLVMRKVDVR